jgi:hypothetical protein
MFVELDRPLKALRIWAEVRLEANAPQDVAVLVRSIEKYEAGIRYKLKSDGGQYGVSNKLRQQRQPLYCFHSSTVKGLN